MELTVIGYWGGYPEVGEACSGYLVQEGDFSLLLDCGSGVASLLPRALGKAELGAVWLSHYHFDHYCDGGALLYGRLVQMQLGNTQTPLFFYGPADSHLDELRWEPYAKCHTYRDGEPFPVGPFRLETRLGQHPVPSHALRLTAGGKTLVYTADTAAFPELVDFARGADLLLAECSFYAGMDGTAAGHMNAADAGRLAREAGAGELVLTHLPHFGEVARLVEQARAEFTGPVSLARGLARYTL